MVRQGVRRVDRWDGCDRWCQSVMAHSLIGMGKMMDVGRRVLGGRQCAGRVGHCRGGSPLSIKAIQP